MAAVFSLMPLGRAQAGGEVIYSFCDAKSQQGVYQQ